MALLPGSLLEISSHFIPVRRSSMLSASSSGVHLDCFFAGDSPTNGLAEAARLFDTFPGPGEGTVFGGPYETGAGEVAGGPE